MVLCLVNGDIFFVFCGCGLMWMIMDDQSAIEDDRFWHQKTEDVTWLVVSTYPSEKYESQWEG